MNLDATCHRCWQPDAAVVVRVFDLPFCQDCLYMADAVLGTDDVTLDFIGRSADFNARVWLNWVHAGRPLVNKAGDRPLMLGRGNL